MKKLQRLFLAMAVLSLVAAGLEAQSLTPLQQLGKSIFFDTDLSVNKNQSCAACHGPAAGWTGPDSSINGAGAVYEGSVAGRFGDRKPPSSAYATQSPVLHFVIEKKEALFIGGNFWDGRATGERLGNPAAEQALGPFLNPMEQALPDPACVVRRVCAAGYPTAFQQVWGDAVCAIAWPADVDSICQSAVGAVVLSPSDRAKVASSYDRVGLSVGAYEGSAEVNAFTSKYDYYLAGKVDLTKEEKMGLNMFMGKGKCAKCHSIERRPKGEAPLLTDFTYDNLGVPRNPLNPVYAWHPSGTNWTDPGLGGFLATRPDYAPYAAANLGKQKVPTLRNVALGLNSGLIKAFAHNGYFKTLYGIVHFYNTRDTKPRCADRFTTEAAALAQGCWPEPEVPANVNTSELGKLRLTKAQEDAIVTFLGTLSDGFIP
jgi:cytochrome c peroxidase